MEIEIEHDCFAKIGNSCTYLAINWQRSTVNDLFSLVEILQKKKINQRFKLYNKRKQKEKESGEGMQG
jgi:hypothetical protein